MIPKGPETQQERVDWLRLIRSENIGPITFFHLLRQFGTAQKALEAIPYLAQKAGSKKTIKLMSSKEAELEFELHQKKKIHLIALGDKEYPSLLTQIEDAPPLISVLGNSHLLQKKTIGIVGSRNASLQGRKLAQNFAKELGSRGYAIISGLARGIDTSAHESSLETGTIAVLAGGVDQIYPPENEKLYYQIAEHGVLLSDNPLTTEPQARHFPRRNRLISGISLGVIVVEASPKSGSLITAQYALDQNREVFAVPGSPLDPRCQGTNNLLKQGAILVQTSADILEVVEKQIPQAFKEISSPQFKIESKDVKDQEIESALQELKSLLSFTPTEIDEIIRLSGISPHVLYSALLALELAGHVVRFPGNKVSLKDEALLKSA